MNRMIVLFAGVALLVAGWAFDARACTTPVFQYAMQRWEPEEYVLEVPQKQSDGSSWGEDVKKVTASTSDDAFPNLVVELADDDTPTTNVLRLSRSDYYRGRDLVWSPPATAENLARVADSPVRQRIVKGLIGGDASVFLLILSGDEKRDASIREMLDKRLPQLAKELQEVTALMPDAADALMDPLFMAAEVPAVIRFSVVTVRRDDPAEAAFLAMLRPLGPEYMDSKDALLIPIFGQGRALAMLPEEYIKDEFLEEICLFLTGPCSCVVKDQNPGLDLLMTADWWSAEYELTDPSAAAQEVVEPEIVLSGVGADVESPGEMVTLAQLREKVEEGLESSAALSQQGDVANDGAMGLIGKIWMIIAGLAILVLLVPVGYKIIGGSSKK